MGTLRIVAGRLRGRRLRVPDDPTLRPTGDRVRQALFNILGQDMTGRSVLDLFAGTGALGFESISRGARRVVFVESSPRAAQAIRRTAEDLGVDREARIVVGRVEDVLRARRIDGPFDVILADPPYDETRESGLVAAVLDSGLLDPEGILAVEREARGGTPEPSGPLSAYRTARYGRAAIDFFKFS